MIWNYEINMIFYDVSEILKVKAEYNIISASTFHSINRTKYTEYTEVFVCYIMV